VRQMLLRKQRRLVFFDIFFKKIWRFFLYVAFIELKLNRFCFYQ